MWWYHRSSSPMGPLPNETSEAEATADHVMLLRLLFFRPHHLGPVRALVRPSQLALRPSQLAMRPSQPVLRP